MYFDPKVWGPHYWFFLHTIAESYPMHPNDVTKKKYYDLIHLAQLFLLHKTHTVILSYQTIYISI